MARTKEADEEYFVFTARRGTLPYMAPEMARCGLVTAEVGEDGALGCMEQVWMGVGGRVLCGGGVGGCGMCVCVCVYIRG